MDLACLGNFLNTDTIVRLLITREIDTIIENSIWNEMNPPFDRTLRLLCVLENCGVTSQRLGVLENIGMTSSACIASKFGRKVRSEVKGTMSERENHWDL